MKGAFMTSSTGIPAGLDARSVVVELFRAFNDHDVDRVVALHAEDAVWEDPWLPVPLTGHVPIAAHVRAIFQAFPDLTFESGPELYEGEEGRLASRWRAGATMAGPLERPAFAPTGRRVTVVGMCVYGFSGGRIARHEQFYDVLGMLEQLGVLPGPESPLAKLAVGLQRASARVARELRRAS